MNSIIRIASIVNKTSVGNPKKCCDNILTELESLGNSCADVIVLPAGALLPPSCGDLAKNPAMLGAARECLTHLAHYTEGVCSYLFAGLPVELGGHIINVMAAFHSGNLIGLLLTPDDTIWLGASIAPPFLPADTVFTCGEARIKVLGGTVDALFPAMELARDADVLILPSYSPCHAGDFARVRSMATGLSQGMGAAIVCVNGGVCDTSAPSCYRGYSITAEDGVLLCADCSDSVAICNIHDIDLQIAHSGKSHKIMPAENCFHAPTNEKADILREVSTMPYLPSEGSAYLQDLFALQSESLAARLRQSGINKVVLGVSGGLDSTLAMLVCGRALDELGLPRENIIAVTMPGFGTGSRTYENAKKLIELSRAKFLKIDIRPSVLHHLTDIGHPHDLFDITYENAQARERTKILFDLANMNGAIVVGTGDLTEIALGWCTFGGDQFAGYNVNSSLPKTLVRHLIKLISTQCGDDLSPLLLDILGTPISPELLPQSDTVSQKSEEILGAYEVHDFFLYYFIKYSFPPQKLLAYANIAFAGLYPPVQIKAQLWLFLKRFAASQFKRSAAPESAAIMEWGLTPSSFSMPSDMTFDVFLDELDKS